MTKITTEIVAVTNPNLIKLIKGNKATNCDSGPNICNKLKGRYKLVIACFACAENVLLRYRITNSH